MKKFYALLSGLFIAATAMAQDAPAAGKYYRMINGYSGTWTQNEQRPNSCLGRLTIDGTEYLGAAQVDDQDKAQYWKFVSREIDGNICYAIVNKAGQYIPMIPSIVNQGGFVYQDARYYAENYTGEIPEEAFGFDVTVRGNINADNITKYDTSITGIEEGDMYVSIRPIKYRNDFDNEDIVDNQDFYLNMSGSGRKFVANLWKFEGVGQSESWILVPEIRLDTSVAYWVRSSGNSKYSHCCLGWYPEPEESSESDNSGWNIVNHNNGEISQGYSPFICIGEKVNSTTDNPQLWFFVEGDGENAGKYAMVNAQFQDGAISNVPYNNAGYQVPNENATNTSRWKYLENRENEPEKVCWFTFDEFSRTEGGDFTTYITFDPLVGAYKYMQVAGPAQNRQVMRYNDLQYIEKWTLEPSLVTTSITSIATSAPETNGIYDLMGHRLNAPIKGINIINGKKVLVK